jgi:Rieske Fe-S protein
MSGSEEYPIKRNDEAKVTRRNFARFMGLTSIVVFFGNLFSDTLGIFKENSERKPMAVLMTGELAVGEAKVVRYPTANDSCILIRTREDSWVAYEQRCTHLMCPVHFRPEKSQLFCPCHEGIFDASSGEPVAGPPRRPLTRYDVHVNNGQVWLS